MSARNLSDNKRLRIVGTITVILRHGDVRSRKRR